MTTLVAAVSASMLVGVVAIAVAASHAEDDDDF
jgi:hypothetical protein